MLAKKSSHHNHRSCQSHEKFHKLSALNKKYLIYIVSILCRLVKALPLTKTLEF